MKLPQKYEDKISRHVAGISQAWLHDRLYFERNQEHSEDTSAYETRDFFLLQPRLQHCTFLPRENKRNFQSESF